jgi:isoamylase
VCCVRNGSVQLAFRVSPSAVLTSVPSAGRSFPLGATPDPHGTNFAVYSEHADRVLICLFDDLDGNGERIFALPGRTGHIWHGHLPGVAPGQAYGFRAEGRYDPWSGDWFNPCKLLVDPYARAITGSVDWNAPVFAYRRGDTHDLSIADLYDSAKGMPLSLVVDSNFDWEGDLSPQIPISDTVIYETHVKGLTALHPEVPNELRGTYRGLVEPPVLSHLKNLGVTSIELLPVQAFVDDEFLVREGVRNFWGYNTLGFFAPEGRYSSVGDAGGQVAEFKQMVKELHRHGIELILDVVYNHTAETGREGPTLSFRGLDNQTYYRLEPHDRSRYQNFSGTGNTVNIEHPAVTRMVLDSLRYWVQECHVDGFRFDLATSLCRDDGAFSTRSRFFTALYQDPVLACVKLIAEPWDVGHGGYQLGHFPVGWSEWNDRFRDATRSFWLGHPVRLGEFALRMTGSADVFDRPGRGPTSGVNFVTCHDGFTLLDLVSYNRKHNEANHESNGDGHNHNLSKNFGIEGPSRDPRIRNHRDRARRNLLATALISHGVPMILGGDELSRSQQGNNNAYPQDNEVSWYHWALSEAEADFLEFTSHLVALRKSCAALRRETFESRELPVPHVLNEVAWRDANGQQLNPQDWERDAPRTLQLVVNHLAEGMSPEPEQSLLVLINADDQDLEFIAPHPSGQHSDGWTVELDTSDARGRSSQTIVPGRPFTMPGATLILARGEASQTSDSRGSDG